MWFKKFLLLSLLVCGLNINLYAEEKIAVTQEKVSTFVEDVGESAVDSLVINLTKLVGDVNNPSVLKGLKELVVKDITKLIMGVGTTLGVSLTKLSVEETAKVVLNNTLIVGSKKGFKSFSKDIIVGIIIDLAKDAVEKTIYKASRKISSELTSRILSGASVAMIEQGIIYWKHHGNLYAILVEEAELVYTRYYGIAKALYKIDKIQNQTAKNSFTLDLNDIQIKYSKEYSKNSDNLPNQSLLNRLNKEVEERVKFYSAEIDLSTYGRTFKNEIYSTLIAHKIIYRYLVLTRLKENKDEIRYYNYLNNYFAPQERWYYKIRYSRLVSPYSDVDAKSRVSTDIYILGTLFNLKYIASQIININNEKLNPNEYVGGKELTVWLEKLMQKVEKADGKSYDETKILFIAGIDYGVYLSNITFAQVVDAFYKEIYGDNYSSCLSGKIKQMKAKIITRNKLKKLNYSYVENRKLYLALARYYSISNKKEFNRLYKYPASYLSSQKKSRSDLIDFGANFLLNHTKNKKIINSCKE